MEAEKAYNFARELDSLFCRLLVAIAEGRLPTGECTQHLLIFWEQRIAEHDSFLESLADALGKTTRPIGYSFGVAEARQMAVKMSIDTDNFKSGFSAELCRFVEGTHAFFSYLNAGTSLGFLPLEEFVRVKKEYAKYWENMCADLNKSCRILKQENKNA